MNEENDGFLLWRYKYRQYLKNLYSTFILISWYKDYVFLKSNISYSNTGVNVQYSKSTNQ